MNVDELLPTTPRAIGTKTFSEDDIAACRRFTVEEMPRDMPAYFDSEPLWFCKMYFKTYLGPFEEKVVQPSASDLEATKRRIAQQETQRRLESLGIPRGEGNCYWNATLGDFFGHLPTIPPGNILITGPNGSGKTHLAAAIAKVRHCRWIAGDIAASTEPVRFPKPWTEATNAVIADLLRGKQTNTGIASLVSLVAHRLENGLRTIVTCDRSAQSILKFDSALGSRLAGFLEVQLEGRDWRQGGGD